MASRVIQLGDGKRSSDREGVKQRAEGRHSTAGPWAPRSVPFKARSPQSGRGARRLGARVAPAPPRNETRRVPRINHGETMAARLDWRPLVFVGNAACALAAVLVLGGCRHDAPEPYRLPTGARLDPV